MTSRSVAPNPGYTGWIVFKDGREERVESGLRRRAIELLSDHTGLSRDAVGNETYLVRGRRPESHVFGFMFRNLCVKVRMDPASSFRAEMTLERQRTASSNVTESDLWRAPAKGVPRNKYDKRRKAQK